VGQKVLATSTKTGKNQAETVTAVLVHHDTDLYDLKVRTGRTTSVIDTTSNHLFWVPTGGGGHWVKAGSLKYGIHLRTPSGTDNAVVTGGWVPAQPDGWMWDLTITPSHDFYIVPATTHRASAPGHDYNMEIGITPVLVHNCNPAQDAVNELRDSGTVSAKRNIAAAEVGIDGQGSYVLRSVSGSAERAGSVSEVGTEGNPQRFIPQATGSNARFSDTEFKLLNQIANNLGPSSDSVSGSVNLYSELPLCASCSSVAGQFQESFPNIDLNITTG
jgi:hypothetical protein